MLSIDLRDLSLDSKFYELGVNPETMMGSSIIDDISLSPKGNFIIHYCDDCDSASFFNLSGKLIHQLPYPGDASVSISNDEKLILITSNSASDSVFVRLFNASFDPINSLNYMSAYDEKGMIASDSKHIILSDYESRMWNCYDLDFQLVNQFRMQEGNSDNPPSISRNSRYFEHQNIMGLFDPRDQIGLMDSLYTWDLSIDERSKWKP